MLHGIFRKHGNINCFVTQSQLFSIWPVVYLSLGLGTHAHLLWRTDYTDCPADFIEFRSHNGSFK